MSPLKKIERCLYRKHNDDTDLGSLIRSRMKALGLEREHLAASLEVSASRVSQLFSEGHQPSYRTLQKLARALDVPVDLLMKKAFR